MATEEAGISTRFHPGLACAAKAACCKPDSFAAIVKY
jgi:hypothetical protein